jgi:hypothetical protein
MRFEAELKKLIEAELVRLHEDLGVGLAVKDYGQYREFVGKIAALKKVGGEFFDEAETNANKG